MRLSSTEEYGLRCLLQIARHGEEGPVTLKEIAEAEGLTPDYVAKLLAPLRRAGLVRSVLGKNGGYGLAREPEEISLAAVLSALDPEGTVSGEGCDRFSGVHDACVHTTACHILPLWSVLSGVVRSVLSGLTLADLLGNPFEVHSLVQARMEAAVRPAAWA